MEARQADPAARQADPAPEAAEEAVFQPAVQQPRSPRPFISAPLTPPVSPARSAWTYREYQNVLRAGVDPWKDLKLSFQKQTRDFYRRLHKAGMDMPVHEIHTRSKCKKGSICVECDNWFHALDE